MNTKFYVSYAYYKLDDKGKPKSKASTSTTVTTTSETMAVQIIKGKHPGY